MGAADMPTVKIGGDLGPAHVYQGGRVIVRSGTSIVTPGSPPLVVSIGGDVRLIHFDLVPEFRRPDGTIVGGPHDAHSTRYASNLATNGSDRR